jgi:GrpB-like predicted nucleotidyltransferase (UPF0157 family)
LELRDPDFPDDEESIMRANHIDSTDVFGLAVKRTIDILFEVSMDTDTDGVIRRLEENGSI